MIILISRNEVEFMTNKDELLRQIPQVEKMMQNEQIVKCDIYRHEMIEAVRDVLTDLRENIKAEEIDKIPDNDEIAQSVVDLATKRSHKNIRRVINGTGVIIHSNLGRASLSKAAAEAVVEEVASYCTLEYDVEKGKRGDRTACVEKYLKDLTGCEAALIVNNNAAAVLLILSAIASGGNVIVSRGELVEIGGGFRVPDIISLCGCSLREVGTTNKTRISDYEAAIDEDTKAILKVHSSNYKIVGFTQSATISELSTFGKSKNIPVIEDIGSGALVDVRRYGINSEPFAAESLKNGADIVSFSGDKLLGGIQCGIILGDKNSIHVIKKHPLYRALRVDKVTVAILEATLRVYADPQAAQREIPVLSMLALSEDVLFARAEKLCNEIRQSGGAAEVESTKSVAGGGAVPGLELNSYAIAPVSSKSAKKIDHHLRQQHIPVIGHIVNDKLLLDVRTIFEEDYEYLVNAVVRVTEETK